MDGSVKDLLARLSARHASRISEAAPLVDEVRSRLPAAAAAIRDRFGAREVILFGSFARGTPIPNSDVDIAVQGVSARDHFRVMSFLSTALGRTVDLVRLEDLEDGDRERLLAQSASA